MWYLDYIYQIIINLSRLSKMNFVCNSCANWVETTDPVDNFSAFL